MDEKDLRIQEQKMEIDRLKEEKERSAYFQTVNLKNASHLGYEIQSMQCIEECAELIQAINKFKRAEKGNYLQEFENLVEEIADVEVMLEQMVWLLKISRCDIDKIKAEKILRTRNRINQK